MKPIKLSERQWHLLNVRLTNDYSPSVMLIRSRMRDKLGFTPRHHQDWTSMRGYINVVYLDFFDDAKRTMFMLKYSEYFNASKD